MSEPPNRELLFAERDRMRGHWMMRTPIGAVQFLNSLVNTVANHWGVKAGVHVYPDGVLNGSPDEPRYIFMEPEVLNLDGLKIDRIELGSISENEHQTSDLVVTTLQMGGTPGGRNRPDVMINQLVNSVRHLSEDGVGVLLASSFYRAFRIGHLSEELSAIGVNVHCLVRTPPRILLPHAGIQPIFVIVSKRPTPNTFALDCKHIEDIAVNVANALNRIDTGDLRTGIKVNLSEFKGFEHWYALREIDSLEGDFTKYEKSKLHEVTMFVNLSRRGEKFEDYPNSVYLPMIGNGPAVDSIDKTSMNHESYAQLVVDTARATPEFLCSYLNTKYFRLYLEAEKLTRSQTPPRLNREQVRLLPVALPELDTQERISTNIRKLAELRLMVDELAQNISVNPVSSASMTQQVDDALAVFGRLSAEDHVVSLIRQGESKTVEFKQTFSLDIADNQKKPYLEDMVIKTIAAFLNSDGGDLLVGVSDDCQLTGINFEIEKLHKSSRDDFLKHFKNRFKTRIGEQFYPRVNYGIVEVGENAVFRISCRPSDIEVFVDEKDFYVRTNPATDKLDGQKLLEYVKHRFGQPPVAVLG
jgi:hypothetical protein